MRSIKMLGLVVVAAFTSMAFIGASSASATNTVLCKENVLACPSGQQYTGHIEALTTHALFKGPLSVECKHSIVLGEALGLANPLIIHVTLLDFSQCNCNVEVTEEKGLILFLKTASNLAFGTAEGFEVKLTCFGVSCTFGGVAEGLHGLGGNPATIVASGVKLPFLEGFFCSGAPLLLTGTYTILLPKPIYIAE